MDASEKSLRAKKWESATCYFVLSNAFTPQMRKCSNAQTHKCTNAQMHNPQSFKKHTIHLLPTEASSSARGRRCHTKSHFATSWSNSCLWTVPRLQPLQVPMSFQCPIGCCLGGSPHLPVHSSLRASRSTAECGAHATCRVESTRCCCCILGPSAASTFARQSRFVAASPSGQTPHRASLART